LKFKKYKFGGLKKSLSIGTGWLSKLDPPAPQDPFNFFGKDPEIGVAP
jgi:hypothetical protein